MAYTTESKYPAATPTPKEAGLYRLKAELDEIAKRLAGCISSVGDAADQLYGTRPQEVAEPIPPSSDTVDGRLGELRRAVTYLEGNIARLHQS